nr:MAG: hypothetical protein [Chemarfal virus 139]
MNRVTLSRSQRCTQSQEPKTRPCMKPEQKFNATRISWGSSSRAICLDQFRHPLLECIPRRCGRRALLSSSPAVLSIHSDLKRTTKLSRLMDSRCLVLRRKDALVQSWPQTRPRIVLQRFLEFKSRLASTGTTPTLKPLPDLRLRKRLRSLRLSKLRRQWTSSAVRCLKQWQTFAKVRWCMWDPRNNPSIKCKPQCSGHPCFTIDSRKMRIWLSTFHLLCPREQGVQTLSLLGPMFSSSPCLDMRGVMVQLTSS